MLILFVVATGCSVQTRTNRFLPEFQLALSYYSGDGLAYIAFVAPDAPSDFETRKVQLVANVVYLGKSSLLKFNSIREAQNHEFPGGSTVYFTLTERVVDEPARVTQTAGIYLPSMAKRGLWPNGAHYVGSATDTLWAFYAKDSTGMLCNDQTQCFSIFESMPFDSYFVDLMWNWNSNFRRIENGHDWSYVGIRRDDNTIVYGSTLQDRHVQTDFAELASLPTDSTAYLWGEVRGSSGLASYDESIYYFADSGTGITINKWALNTDDTSLATEVFVISWKDQLLLGAPVSDSGGYLIKVGDEIVGTVNATLNCAILSDDKAILAGLTSVGQWKTYSRQANLFVEESSVNNIGSNPGCYFSSWHSIISGDIVLGYLLFEDGWGMQAPYSGSGAAVLALRSDLQLFTDKPLLAEQTKYPSTIFIGNSGAQEVLYRVSLLSGAQVVASNAPQYSALSEPSTRPTSCGIGLIVVVEQLVQTGWEARTAMPICANFVSFWEEIQWVSVMYRAVGEVNIAISSSNEFAIFGINYLEATTE